MEIGLLGPLVVRMGGTSLVPTAAKPRQLLALLAAQLGREVSVAALAEEMWDGEPPRAPSAAVQTYVKLLRRGITTALRSQGEPDDGAKAVLSRGHTGYVLHPTAAVVESNEFERLSGRGLRALAAGDGAEAAVLLGRALAMWRGPVLADVPQGPILRAEALRLEEVRRAALEARISADLRLGRHAEVVGELIALTARHPLQENLHALLMLALYRGGRSWQALAVYRELRRACVDQLGIEPGQRLRRLHRAILDDDPQLSAHATDLVAF